MSFRFYKLRKEHGSRERFDNPNWNNTKPVNSNTTLICASSCCCFIFLYLTVVGSFMGIFYVETADDDLVSCNAPQEVYKIENTCLSKNEELDLKVNSSVRTKITQCTTGKVSRTRCEMPKTFVFYDLLSMPRMASRLGYYSQCALEGTQTVEQRDV